MTVFALRWRQCAARSLLGVVLCLFGAIVFAQTPTETTAANAIEHLDAAQTGEGVVLTIHLKSPISGAPSSFSVTNPPRIALDLPSTANHLGKNSVAVDQGDLRSVNIVQAQGRARVVLNLKRTQPYRLAVKDQTLVITLGGNLDQPTFAANATDKAAVVAGADGARSASSGTARTVRTLDFRRGGDGEGKVLVDLGDPNTSVDVHQQGANLIVDFALTTLPEALRKKLDVTDFGTPVAVITGSQQGSNARLTIEPRGQWEQNAYQTDNRFVLEVKPVKEDPTRLFQGSHKGYQGERLSLNFQNVDVRSLLQVIADFTNLNIITSDSVQGSITLRLKDVPWDQALDIILQTKGLDMRKNGNVILVGPREELANKEKIDLETRNQIAELEPLHTENFVVNYQKVEDVRKMLLGIAQQNQGVANSTTAESRSMLSKRGSIVVDARTNQMFVTDTALKLEDIRRFLARIDIAVKQVMIEARIVEAQDSFSSDIGARLGVASLTGRGWVSSGASNGASLGTGTSTSSSTSNGGNISLTNSGGGTLTWGAPNNVNLPAGNLNGYSPGSIGLTLFNSSLTKLLNLEVSALELDGKGKVISSPRVVTADKVKASIEEGQDIPYQSASAAGGIGQVQFRKAVLSLEVTPQITPEGAIFLDVKVNKDTPSATVSGSGGIAIDTKNVTTQVLVENGGTVVLGGIFQDTETVTTTKIPVLGDIPVLGNLFKDTAKTKNRDELLIFITPRIISERVNQAAQ